MTPPLPTGWIDDRLCRAYYLIEDALDDHNNPETDVNALLVEARDAIERADVELEKSR